MIRRPWYRSRLFWLGVPGLLFLLWAWRDSGTHARELFWSGRQEVYELETYLGSVMLSHYVIHYDDGPKRFDVRQTEYPPVVDEDFPVAGSLVFPKAIQVFRRPPSQFSEKGIRVAYWLISLCYLMAWWGGLAGWRYGMSCRSKFQIAPPP